MMISADELIVLFFIYSFIGYLWEVSCVFVLQQKLVNRGFLYGPCIPLYGLGAILILYTTLSFSSMIQIFVYGAIFASILEYITGELMLNIFKVRYWDYSDAFCNIKGYICLKASIVWGIFSLLLVKSIHPAIYKTLKSTNIFNNSVLIYILIVVFVIDVTLSIKNALDFKSLLEKLKADNNNNGIPDIIETIPEHMKEKIDDAKNRLIKLKEKHPTAVFDERLQEIIRKIHRL